MRCSNVRQKEPFHLDTHLANKRCISGYPSGCTECVSSTEVMSGSIRPTILNMRDDQGQLNCVMITCSLELKMNIEKIL